MAGLLLGVVSAAVLDDLKAAPPEPPGAPITYPHAIWPDGQIDICLRSYSPQAGDITAFRRAVEAMSRTSFGRTTKVGEAGVNVDAGCSADPPFNPTSADISSTHRDLRVDTQGSFDVYVFVYPQVVADRLGTLWSQRITAQEILVDPASGGGAEVTSAVFLGDEEARNLPQLLRLLQRGLGLAGAGTDYRPRIDNVCVVTDPSKCGPDPFVEIQ